MRLNYITTIASFMIFLVFTLPIIHAEELNLVYDKNGNLVTGDGFYREYNAFNQLWKIYNGSDSSGMLLQELEHHPMEERVWIKKVYNESGNVTETTYYFSKEFVRVENSSGTYDYTYIYHEGSLIAERLPDGSKIFHHTDHLNSMSLTTDGSGNAIENSSFAPFGLAIDGGEVSRYSYESKEFDSLLGDFDFHFRKYCARWGKFCQPDTLIPNLFDPQTLNRYAFEKNNPFNTIDEDGHNPVLFYKVLLVIGLYLTGHAGQAKRYKEREDAEQSGDKDRIIQANVEYYAGGVLAAGGIYTSATGATGTFADIMEIQGNTDTITTGFELGGDLISNSPSAYGDSLSNTFTYTPYVPANFVNNYFTPYVPSVSDDANAAKGAGGSTKSGGSSGGNGDSSDSNGGYSGEDTGGSSCGCGCDVSCL